MQRIRFTIFAILQIIFWGTIAYFTFLLLLICLQYIPIQYDVAFLVTKQSCIHLGYFKIAFFTHVFSAIFAIIFGGIQFVTFVRINYKSIHQIVGKLYIGIILLLAGPSGLVLGIYANGGLIAQFSFTILSIIWMVFTFKALLCAKKKDFQSHQSFMIRSYALTLSAISLRLLKLLIVHTVAWPPMDTYVIVSWASWLMNLLLAELVIYRLFSKKNNANM
jgi:Predicted membrane protein (DUF2306)